MKPILCILATGWLLAGCFDTVRRGVDTQQTTSTTGPTTTEPTPTTTAPTPTTTAPTTTTTTPAIPTVPVEPQAMVNGYCLPRTTYSADLPLKLAYPVSDGSCKLIGATHTRNGVVERTDAVIQSESKIQITQNYLHEETPFQWVLDYEFDTEGRIIRSTTTAPSGTNVETRAYDSTGRQIGYSLTTNHTTVARQRTYDDAGRLTAVAVQVSSTKGTDTSEVVVTYSYDADGRMTAAEHREYKNDALTLTMQMQLSYSPEGLPLALNLITDGQLVQSETWTWEGSQLVQHRAARHSEARMFSYITTSAASPGACQPLPMGWRAHYDEPVYVQSLSREQWPGEWSESLIGNMLSMTRPLTHAGIDESVFQVCAYCDWPPYWPSTWSSQRSEGQIVVLTTTLSGGAMTEERLDVVPQASWTPSMELSEETLKGRRTRTFSAGLLFSDSWTEFTGTFAGKTRTLTFAYSDGRLKQRDLFSDETLILRSEWTRDESGLISGYSTVRHPNSTETTPSGVSLKIKRDGDQLHYELFNIRSGSLEREIISDLTGRQLEVRAHGPEKELVFAYSYNADGLLTSRIQTLISGTSTQIPQEYHLEYNDQQQMIVERFVSRSADGTVGEVKRQFDWVCQ